jgi:hypothetical protein
MPEEKIMSGLESQGEVLYGFIKNQSNIDLQQTNIVPGGTGKYFIR